MYKLIDGKVISKQIKDELKEKVAGLKAEGVEICLAVIQVGNDPASSVYVGNKKKACEYIGIGSLSYELPEETTEEELLALIEKLNSDDKVNGILVQLPLPKHIDEDKVIKTISPKKDVDGFHPMSVGALSIGQPGFVSCTPAGVIQLIKRSGIEIEGKECASDETFVLFQKDKFRKNPPRVVAGPNMKAAGMDITPEMQAGIDNLFRGMPSGHTVGRNDPCPCGSGKKYKKCCGRNN